jgi:maltokinase
MTQPVSDEERARLAFGLRRIPAVGLLPPRRSDASPTSLGDLRDALSLPGGSRLAVVRAGDHVLVAPVVPGHNSVRRARPGDGAYEGIFELMRRGGGAGRFTAWPMGDPGPDPGTGERAIDVDQSNDSVVVGEGAVVKLFPLTRPGSQPGLDMPVHLAEAGFDEMPAPLGALVWTEDDGTPVLLATAAAYLPGARDGWDWYLDRLVAWLDGETGDDTAFEPAPRLGRLAARLHVALATPTRHVHEPLRIAGPDSIAAWRDDASATMARALSLTSGEVHDRLRRRAGELAEALGELDGIAETPVTRIHGDLHVGQVLEWEGGLAVTDFDGNPLAPVERREALDTPVRDVAALVRSVDHVGRIAQARRPGREDDIARWILASRSELLDSYWGELAARGRAQLFDGRLLRPLEVAQELHEYVYAATYLPRWGYVPDLAIRAMFPRDEA